MTEDANESALQTIFADASPTARRIRQARLIVTRGPSVGSEAVVDKHRTFVGRGLLNDLVIDDSQVSTSHLEIEVTESGYLVRDLGSTNGTWFEGARIRELFLSPGRTFELGDSAVRLEATPATVDIPLSAASSFGEMTGHSVPMREVFAVMEKVAPSELTVLIRGETGTGKERLARSIHAESTRSDGPYVVLDCSSIPRELAESTMFGHEKGAFTGASASHKGAFEQADGGTIFLDEVGELDLALQPKLLRVLENREVRPVGGDRIRQVDVRVVAATNRNLREMVAEGTFREDLYFRLSVIQCELPPLRERVEDVESLARQILGAFESRRPELGRLRLAPDALDRLRAQRWPGNVRQLKNVLERTVSLCDSGTIQAASLSIGDAPALGVGSVPEPWDVRSRSKVVSNDGTVRAGFDVPVSSPFKEAKASLVAQFESLYLKRVVADSDGNLSRAAESVGLTRYHLRELLKKHGLLAQFRNGSS